MSDKTGSFIYVTYIRSTREKVFEAITKPEIVRQYWGHENISEWKPQSKWAHVRLSDPSVSDIVGKVVEIDPPKRLVLSWVDPANEDNADEYSKVTFDIEPDRDGMVKLTVSHTDLQPESGMFNGISKGWPLVLSSMKSYLETGKGMDL